MEGVGADLLASELKEVTSKRTGERALTIEILERVGRKAERAEDLSFPPPPTKEGEGKRKDIARGEMMESSCYVESER